MLARNSGERKLTEPHFIRLKKFTDAGSLPQLSDILDDATLLPSRSEGILLQPEATGDYVT